MKSLFRRWGALAAVMALMCPRAGLGAEKEESKEPPPQVSEAVATALQKINTMITGEQWDAALAEINQLLKTTKRGTYDYSLIQLHLAQVHLSRNKPDLGDYAAAIPALKSVIESGFWEKERTLEWKYILAQLCAQQDRLEEAERYVREWLAETTEPTADGYVLYVTLLVQRAQSDAENVDKALLEEALAAIRKGLRIGAKPHETLYYLQAACFQGLERWEEAAEALELLLKRNPRNKTYWSQLFSMYVTAADDLRAALTIERAHRYDAMNSPRENIALAQLYHNMRQFDRSIEILEKGLADGTIEPIKQHWEMLGHGYQELHQEYKAIDTFLRADKYVDDGYFLGLAGYTYYALQKNAEAVKYLEMAVKKGVDNMGQLSLFGAYLAFELKQYDRASAFLDIAKEHLADERQQNDYRGLRDVVNAAIQQQKLEEEQKQQEAQQGGAESSDEDDEEAGTDEL